LKDPSYPVCGRLIVENKVSMKAIGVGEARETGKHEEGNHCRGAEMVLSGRHTSDRLLDRQSPVPAIGVGFADTYFVTVCSMLTEPM
jgi:hypothetical protein